MLLVSTCQPTELAKLSGKHVSSIIHFIGQFTMYCTIVGKIKMCAIDSFKIMFAWSAWLFLMIFH